MGDPGPLGSPGPVGSKGREGRIGIVGQQGQDGEVVSEICHQNTGMDTMLDIWLMFILVVG